MATERMRLLANRGQHKAGDEITVDTLRAHYLAREGVAEYMDGPEAARPKPKPRRARGTRREA